MPLMPFYRIIYRLNCLWAKSVLWLFKKIVGCDYRIEGLENLPIWNSGTQEKQSTKHKSYPLPEEQGEGGVRVDGLQASNFQPKTNQELRTNNQEQTNKGFVIASKHQSAWETIVAFTFLPKVCFVYKKELSYIPIYGWYNIAYRNIKVSRGAGVRAVKSVVEGVKKRVAACHQVVIFPQGTRTPFGVENPYKSSIYAMYAEGIPVYPAALNSGNHWPKHGAKRGGTIVWKFLPKIEPGLSKADFMARLEAAIEIESNRLDENSAAHAHSAHCGCNH